MMNQKELFLELLEQRKAYYKRRQDYHKLGLGFWHLVMVEYYAEQETLRDIDNLLVSIAKEQVIPRNIADEIKKLEPLGEDR